MKKEKKLPPKSYTKERIILAVSFAVVLSLGAWAAIRMTADKDANTGFVRLKLIDVSTGAVMFRDLSAEYKIGDMFTMSNGDSSIFNQRKVVVIERTPAK